MTQRSARGWYVEVDDTGGYTHAETALTGDGLGPQRNPKANARPTIRVPVPKSGKWATIVGDGSADIDMRVWNDGRRQPIDTLDRVEERPDATILVGSGGRELRQRVTVARDQQQVHKFAEDLVGNTAYTSNVDAPAETTDTNVTLDSWSSDSEFSSRYDPALLATDPIDTSGGAVNLLQSAFHIDANSNRTGGAGQTNGSQGGSSDYVDGFAAELDAMGEGVEATVTTVYDIPEEHVGVAVRQGADDTPAVSYTLDGQEIDTVSQSATTITFGWDDVGDGQFDGFGWQGGTLSAGSHTVKVECDVADSGVPEVLAVDWIVLYDQRFNYNFDNSTDGNDELAGPELYPDSVRVSFREIDAPRSVTGARAELTVDEGSSPSNEFDIRLSNDQGANFSEKSNSDTFETDSLGADFGPSVILQVDLSRYGSQTETPTAGISGHSVEAVTLKADLSSIPIVRNYTVDDHIDKALTNAADIADALWGLSWDGNNDRIAVEWTFPGQRTATETPDTSDFKSAKSVDTVYEKAAVYGRSDVPVVGEGFTSNHGTAVGLNNDRIQPNTDSVVDPSTGERFVRGVDYSMDYQAGEITALSGGSLSNSTAYEIDYAFQAFGEFTKSGVVSPNEAPPATIPGLVSDFLCKQAARLIIEEVDAPLHTATMTLPNDETAWGVVESLDPPIVPTGGNALHVKQVENTPEATVLTLGSRRTLDEVVADIRSQVGAVSRKA